MKKQKPRLQQSYGEPKKFVTVKLPVRIIEILDKIATLDNITRSYLISDILDNYVKQANVQNCLKEIKEDYKY
jgi:metal-responsive CopG/Arc/MetJ family transcriptional regulator